MVAHYYTELAVSSPAVADTRCAYPRRVGQAEWAWKNIRDDRPAKDGHQTQY